MINEWLLYVVIQNSAHINSTEEGLNLDRKKSSTVNFKLFIIITFFSGEKKPFRSIVSGRILDGVSPFPGFGNYNAIFSCLWIFILPYITVLPK